MSDSHRRKILATCEICEVVRCADGGAIHLHFGTASIRAKEAAYSILCQALLSALGRVAPEMVEMNAPAMVGSNSSH